MTDLKPTYCPHPPEVAEVVEKLAEAIDTVLPVVAAAVDAVLPIFRKVWDTCKLADIPPKWIYLAAHAKKARVRKKYCALCARRVAEVMI